jgi:hypothetical protein
MRRRSRRPWFRVHHRLDGIFVVPASWQGWLFGILYPVVAAAIVIITPMPSALRLGVLVIEIALFVCLVGLTSGSAEEA